MSVHLALETAAVVLKRDLPLPRWGALSEQFAYRLRLVMVHWG
jgi:hypothetical protein